MIWALWAKGILTTTTVFFETLKTMVKPPDLLIYLKARANAGRANSKTRHYEENIRLDYLKNSMSYIITG